MGFSSNYFLYWSNLNEVITPFIAFICECSVYYQLFCVFNHSFSMYVPKYRGFVHTVFPVLNLNLAWHEKGVK